MPARTPGRPHRGRESVARSFARLGTRKAELGTHNLTDVFVDDLNAGQRIDDANAVGLPHRLGAEAGPHARLILRVPALEAIAWAVAAPKRFFNWQVEDNG